ncbi:MAG: DPP IV N-terminal domain-containing protein, partial [Bacteroidetes bacterium]|nr:DPP IV N-terminal domain-containing protein [Bacteroidota bacterium]
MKYLLITLITPLFFNSFISQKTQIDNTTIWYNGVFYPENISGVNSMNDGEHFTSLDYNQETEALEINKYSYANYEKVETILSSADFKPDGKKAIPFDDYQFSSDETKLLLATEQEAIYRHSSKSNYYIYDITSKKISALSDFSKGKQRLAEFSPNGNKVAFVRENNIFIN